MEMILNEYDMAVGARFENGTIQDYVDKEQTYGLLRIEDKTVNWFLYNAIESDDEVKKLYDRVIKEAHFIHDDFGEEIVLFNKVGDISYEDMLKKIDEYMDDGVGSLY
jgi:hypothetical protein